MTLLDVYLLAAFPGVNSQDAYAERVEALLVCPPAGWTAARIDAAHPVSRASRQWLRLGRDGHDIYFNGYLLIHQHVSTGAARAARRGDVLDHVTPLLQGRVSIALRPRHVCTTEMEAAEALESLSVWTTAVLLLDRAVEIAMTRPDVPSLHVEQCDRWLRTHGLRYLTGRGAQYRVLVPWEDYIARYRGHTAALRDYWRRAVQPLLCRIAADHPLRPLVEPLRLLSVERDEQDILAEYQGHIARLSQDSGRVGVEIGIIGLLVSLALIPVQEQVGLLLLLIAVAAALLYYFSYSVARMTLQTVGLIKRASAWRRAASRPGPADVDASITHSLRQLRDRPSAVLVGSRSGMGDFGSAVRLWLALLQRHTLEPSERSVLCTDDACEAESRGVVVMGGPLVRPQNPFPRPLCDLQASAAYDHWRYQAASPLASPHDDETIGCVSGVAQRRDVLFLNGFRDTGTAAATGWLIRQLAVGELQPDIGWCLLKRKRRVTVVWRCAPARRNTPMVVPREIAPAVGVATPK
jgi:hypothetical protein